MEKRKRILFVITKASWGGAQRYVYDLALAAREANHEVSVAYGEPGLLAERLKEAGIRTIPVHALGRDVRAGSDLAALRALQTLFGHERPDVLHLNSSKASGLGAFAGRLAGVPRIIYTSHGWAFNETRPLWQKFAIRIFAGATVYLSTETICVSEAVRNDMRWLPFSHARLVVIHNGIRCATLLPPEGARKELLPAQVNAQWIGMVSELHPTKRVEDAIEAFASISARHPRTILVVIGEGEERTKLEELIRARGLSAQVFLLGFVTDASRYLGAFDIFLHSSQSEALGYAVLEAGCASLPAIATRVGGIPEIIEDGVSGILVPRRHPYSIAQAIEKLLEDKAYAHLLGAALHERVLHDFSQSETIRRTLVLYA